MADNITLNSGTGGADLATDDIGGVQHQRVKLQYGTDGSATDVSDSNPLPIDDAGGSLTVDGAVTANAGTGTMTVTDDGSFTLAANSGVDIGDVDVTSVVTGTGASNLGKAEDAAHSTGDVGVMSLVVRNDTLAALAGTDGDYAPLQVNASGALYIQEGSALDVSGATVTIDGAHIATEGSALGSGVLLQGDDGTDRKNVAVDATSGNVQVDVASALPSGTNAIGKLAANSGVDIGDVDVTSVTPGTAASNLGKAEDAAHSTGDVGVMSLTVRNDTLAALAGTDGDYAPLQVNASGALYIQEGAALDVSGATVTTTPAVTGGGTEASAQRVTLASDSTGVLSVDDNGGSLTIDGAHIATEGSALGSGVLLQGDDGTDRKNVAVDATSGNVQVDVSSALPSGNNNIGNVDIASSLPAGTNAIGKLSANSGVDIGDVDVTSISAGSNLIGDVGIGVRTSGGTTLYKNIDVDESEDQIKGSAGQLYWFIAINISTSVLYLKFYDALASNVTVGSTVPDLTIPVPTQGGTTDAAGMTISIPNGIEFGTAITVACTTGVADNDSGAPGANEMVLNLGYN